MKHSTILILIIFWGVMAIIASKAEVNLPTGLCDDSKSESVQCSCSPVTNGMQYCASISTSFAKDKSYYRIMVNDSLRNVSEKSMKIPSWGDISDIYSISVMDPAGNDLLSEREILEKKALEKNEPMNVPMSTREPVLESSQVKELSPNEELRSEFNLCSLYKLVSKGMYQVEISRRLPKPDGSGFTELSAGTFSFEIK